MRKQQPAKNQEMQESQSSSLVSKEDEAARLDEIVAIQSIYPELFFQDSPTRIILKFEKDIRLTVDLPFDYPSKSPPCFELSGPNLRLRERLSLSNSLSEEYMSNLGMPVLFSWINVVNEFIQNLAEGEVEENCDLSKLNEDVQEISPIGPMYDIKHGEVFSDRKSHFQAHLCEVTSKEQVSNVIKQLLTNNKIARATHNMYAYRIKEVKDGREFSIHDCFDDGEDGASSKMLDILEKIKAENIIVIVTRWYGGIHLGPDRFRIINNLTREIVTQYGHGSR